MKKLFVALMALVLVGCSSGTTTPTATPEVEETPALSTGLSVGVGSVTSLSMSDATADAEGKAQANTTYAVVVLEGDVIKYVSFDVAQNTVNFDTTGVVLTAADAATPTKKEKGEDYGMRSSSEIGKEWFEQIAVLEEYAVGKTVEEFLATPVTDNVTTDADLLAGCTIKINGYLAAFEVAAANAVAVEGVVEVGVGSSTSISLRDAAADTTGRGQVNTTFAVVALDADGKILYTSIDVAQNSMEFDTTGVVVTAADAATPTKKEKGEDYGMRSSSGIGKEWFEQIASLEEYATGKTVEEFLATPLTDSVTTDADLLTSVTIKLDGYFAAVEAASTNKVVVE
ncbi:MAG: hypothetical protein ACK5LZ_07075 [Anaerorhabdus sp.]